MANVINRNPQYPDLFLGAVEQAGTFQNDKGEEVKFHYFLLDIALGERDESSNIVSSCGYECLGFAKTSVDGKTKFTDKRKVKATDIPLIFGMEISSADQLNSKLFQNCEVLWDKNGAIKRITFEEPFPKMVTKATK